MLRSLCLLRPKLLIEQGGARLGYAQMKQAHANVDPQLTSEQSADALAQLASRRVVFLDFLRRRIPAAAEPENLLQRALLIAARRIEQLRQVDRAVPWFYTILRRVVADHFKAEVARSRVLADYRYQAAGSLAPAAWCGCSREVVSSLPPRYAEVLRRVDLGEEDLAEVAQSLGTTQGNVAVRLCRARKALREQLLAVCGTTSWAACLECRCGEAALRPIGAGV